MALTPQELQEREARHAEFIANAIKNNPVEAKIVRKIVKALKKAGTPVTSVWDGVEETPATTTKEILALVFNLDQCHLYTEGTGWVFLVGGNEWDMLSDYTVSLEEALKPVNDWIDKYND
jgi:hypothetical protein